MEFTDIIVILLFIIPGIIADKISGFIDVCDKKKDSEFKEIADGVLMSLPIVFFIAFISYRINDFTNSEDFIKAFKNIYYVITFTLGVIVLSGVWGILKGILGIIDFDLINFIRTKVLKKVKIDNKTCWQNFFHDDGTNQFLVVEKDGKTHEGFIMWYSLPGEEKELVLYTPDDLEPYPEYRLKLSKVKCTYVNIEKDIVIKDYDTTEYDKWCDELRRTHQQTTS